jgi:hypothetical protein
VESLSSTASRKRRGLILAGAVTLGSAALAGPALASGGSTLSPAGQARAYVAGHSAGVAAGDQATGAGLDSSCFSAADNHVDPEVNSSGQPTNPAWFERDALNVYCSTTRLVDQVTNPTYGYQIATQGSGLWISQLGQQLSDGAGHIHGGATTLVPGSQAADGFRTASDWESRTGGDVVPVSFPSADGSVLRGEVWLPPAGTPTLADGHYPGVVITDGSVQGYQNLYYWAAEGLAQYGYEVMTYDVQGQGDSDLFPAGCPSLSDPTIQCKGVPYQQSYNFYQGAEDSLSYFLSSPAAPYKGTYNPGWKTLDPAEVGIAGHSLGAEAVSWVGQCDNRVRAIAAWDDLTSATISQCPANVTVAAADRAGSLHAPALALTNDYEFNPQPQTSVPDPNGSSNGGGLDGTAGYLSLARSGVDSEIVSVRDGTHLTYSYIPYVLPANEIGERVAFYYTLAWFDEYLRGGHDPLLPAGDTAYRRLTALSTYDQSADRNGNTGNPAASVVSFGAGTFSAARAAADPTDPTAGNVPYDIDGISIPDTLSFYYYSEYRLHDLDRAGRPVAACTDMLAGCPARQPSTP